MRSPSLLITRPIEAAERFADQARTLGFDPILAPMLTIEFAQRANLNLDGVQAVLLTSGHGARALAHATNRRDVLIFTVGNATAEVAKQFGFTNVSSANGDGAALASLVTRRLVVSNGPVVHASGDKQAFDIVGALSQKGFDARLALLYNANPVKRLPADTLMAITARRIDYAAFFSPHTGRTFGRLVRQAGAAEAMTSVTAVSISPNVSNSLGGLIWRKQLTVEKPTAAAILDLLAGSVSDAASEDGAG